MAAINCREASSKFFFARGVLSEIEFNLAIVWRVAFKAAKCFSWIFVASSKLFLAVLSVAVAFSSCSFAVSNAFCLTWRSAFKLSRAVWALIYLVSASSFSCFALSYFFCALGVWSGTDINSATSFWVCFRFWFAFWFSSFAFSRSDLAFTSAVVAWSKLSFAFAKAWRLLWISAFNWSSASWALLNWVWASL